MQGRKKEADAFLKDQNELVHNQSALFQVNIHQASQNSQVHEEAVVRSSRSFFLARKELMRCW